MVIIGMLLQVVIIDTLVLVITRKQWSVCFLNSSANCFVKTTTKNNNLIHAKLLVQLLVCVVTEFFPVII